MASTAAQAAPESLTRDRDALEAALRAAVGEEASGLAAAARYVMGWEDVSGAPANAGGKRIRPLLCLLAGRIFGGSTDTVMPGAVALELVHNFSLVHDDIQDRDDQRHGRPTAWRVHGEAQAINLGDYLYMCAIRALTTGAGDPERRIRALDVLNDAVGRMIGGQWADIGFESRDDVGVDEYLDMSAGKTGALLGAPMEMGALLAGASTGDAALAGRWGQRIGLAFQACDDYLGIWGDPTLTGKSNASDLKRRKKSLAIVFGLNSAKAGATLRQAFAAPGEIGDTTVLVEALEAAGANRFCLERATSFVEEAEAFLSDLELAPAARAELRAVADYLVNRRA